MNERPPYRSTFVHYASDAWIISTLQDWRALGIGTTESSPQGIAAMRLAHIPWFWIRDVREVFAERGLTLEEEEDILRT